VIRALARADNNVSQAARQLGIGRATLYRHINRLGLSKN
jgi:transcriptional regulator of acetoin/glycerol metabolism